MISLISCLDNVFLFNFFFIKITLLGGGERLTSTFCPILNPNLCLISDETAISFSLTKCLIISIIAETSFGFFEIALIEILSSVWIPIFLAVFSFSIATGNPAVHFKSLILSSIFYIFYLDNLYN